MGQMGAGDGDAGGGAGGHPHQYHYQALLAAVQNPNQTLHPFSLPFPFSFPAGPGADASPPNAAPHSQTPRGFSDWSTSNSSFASLAGPPAPATTNSPFNYNLPPSYALWTPYMLNKNMAYSYPASTEEHAHTLHHTHQNKESGSAPSLGVESFTTMSLGPNICTQISPVEGSISTKEAENSEDLPAAVRSSDEMEIRNSGEFQHDDILPEPKQAHESCNTKFNSGEYQVVLRKELTKSDVANVGRIVLPKKDAEASLPPLVQGDHLILQMDDMVLPITWKFKYRFWPNNKSRMYILESAGEFVKTHGLQAGDALIIYKNSVPGKFIIRGEKAIQQATNT